MENKNNSRSKKYYPNGKKGGKYNRKAGNAKAKETTEQYTTQKDDNVCKSGYNEPRWYNANDRLVQDAVKIPFTN